MTYQALYRVYRPQRFDEMAGQQTISRTLKHAIANHKTSHAYLFTGPRGTGKTSAAKIFAKAINCPHQKEGEPCNQCEICQQITKGALNDVIEIDAASNNGVEEIRDIREKANYAPTQASYKVYIIDEVHMLSQGAFNALLKTLEEPPSHVIFILATTEPHKIPLTIISRTQRFDFKRINEAAMIKRMEDILEEENIGYEEDVLPLIAQAAEGGMRDALSILDQTISFSLDSLTVEDALLVTGALTQSLLHDYIQALSHQDLNQALTLLHDLLKEGKDPQRFADDVILFCRDLLIQQQSKGEQELMKRARLTDEFEQLSQELDTNFLYNVISVFNQAQHDLRRSNHAPVYLELASIQLIQADNDSRSHQDEGTAMDMEVVKQLEEQILDLQQTVKSLEQGASSAHSNQADRPTPARTESQNSFSASAKLVFKANKSQIFQVLSEATKEDLARLKELWPDLLNALSTTGRALIRASKPVAASPDGAVISFQYDILCQRASENNELQNELKQYIDQLSGQGCQFVFVTDKQWPSIRQDFIQRMKTHHQPAGKQHDLLEEADQQAKEQEEKDQKIVDQAVDLFGSDLVQVKDE